ncbi:substrate-binding domain-containing protein [Nisaea sp.]|uniref:substrate-binding domain-containing protein n=1 Tax=Nisaea sp. TaxID=2024842 RepID=UPI00329885CE
MLDDNSIVGIDNLEFRIHINSPFTTVDVPSETIGLIAADYISENRTGERASPHNPLKIELILRDSSTPAAAEMRSD